MRTTTTKRNGYYIFEEDFGRGKGIFPGVSKKIDNQLHILSAYYSMHEIPLKLKKNKLAKRLPFGSFLYEWKDAKEKIINADFVYIRKPLIDSGFRHFLRQIKKDNPDIIILMEIPTYPYDKEQFFSSFSRLPFYTKDYYNRNRLKGLIDRIVTYTNDDEIFGIPTIKIQNGIDVSEIPILSPCVQDKDTINLIAVASLQPYHGYERIFKGLRDYYDNNGTRKILFHVVGSGSIESELKQLVQRLHLDDSVLFYGTKTGEDLTDIFNKSDIGIGSFGFYKIGLQNASSLKTREYLARGLPVVSGCSQDIFEIAPCDYHLEFPNDASTVNIQMIVDFYDRLFKGKKKESVFSEIRKYAEKNATMKKAFSPVIDYLSERTKYLSYSEGANE